MSVLLSHAAVLDPRDLGEALAMRAAHPDAVPLAGGTEVMVHLEAGMIDPQRFLNLWRVDALRGISGTPDGGLRIGALTTHRDLVLSADVARVAPALAEAARTVGAVQIQNRGTLGGNIINASPAADTLPVLLALDAVFEVQGATHGARRFAAADFFVGYRKLALAPDDLLVAVHLPPRHAADHTHFRKVGTRLAQAISKVMLGARVRVEGGVVTDARVAFGSVGPTPLRARSVEAALLGRPVDPGAADLASRDVTPLDDIRSTAEYRRAVCVSTLRAFLASIAPA